MVRIQSFLFVLLYSHAPNRPAGIPNTIPSTIASGMISINFFIYDLPKSFLSPSVEIGWSTFNYFFFIMLRQNRFNKIHPINTSEMIEIISKTMSIGLFIRKTSQKVQSVPVPASCKQDHRCPDEKHIETGSKRD